jgi:hypothetical protein
MLARPVSVSLDASIPRGLVLDLGLITPTIGQEGILSYLRVQTPDAAARPHHSG